MAVIRYSIGKLLFSSFLLLAMAGFFLCVLLRPEAFMYRHGRGMGLLHFIAEHDLLSGGIFALCFGGVVLLVSLAFGDRAALTIGPGGVEVRTMLARRKAGWAEVAGIGFEMHYKREMLIVRLGRDIGEKKIRLAMNLLAQSREEIVRLLASVEPMRGGRTAERPAIPRPAMRGGFGRRGV